MQNIKNDIKNDMKHMQDIINKAFDDYDKQLAKRRFYNKMGLKEIQYITTYINKK